MKFILIIATLLFVQVTIAEKHVYKKSPSEDQVSAEGEFSFNNCPDEISLKVKERGGFIIVYAVKFISYQDSPFISLKTKVITGAMHATVIEQFGKSETTVTLINLSKKSHDSYALQLQQISNGNEKYNCTASYVQSAISDN